MVEHSNDFSLIGDVEKRARAKGVVINREKTFLFFLYCLLEGSYLLLFIFFHFLY